jgi:hypothetical protein
MDALHPLLPSPLPLYPAVRLASIERATKHASLETHPGEKTAPMQFSPSLIDRYGAIRGVWLQC